MQICSRICRITLFGRLCDTHARNNADRCCQYSRRARRSLYPGFSFGRVADGYHARRCRSRKRLQRRINSLQQGMLQRWSWCACVKYGRDDGGECRRGRRCRPWGRRRNRRHESICSTGRYSHDAGWILSCVPASQAAWLTAGVTLEMRTNASWISIQNSDCGAFEDDHFFETGKSHGSRRNEATADCRFMGL